MRRFVKVRRPWAPMIGTYSVPPSVSVGGAMFGRIKDAEYSIQYAVHAVPTPLGNLCQAT